MHNMPQAAFQEALDYLYSFIDYSVQRSYRYSPEEFDLERVRQLLAALGNPQDQFSSVHVAGTKGKGSVTALIAACLRSAGYRTADYTSPHLVHFTERIRVNGEPIPQGRVVELVERMKPAVAEIPKLTTYELTTALGFLHFAQEQVDWAVVEVGLGGRLDATNVLLPQACVITSLSYDHMHLLGNSLSDIAREKAGIIKPGVPVVLAPQQHEALQVATAIAEQRGSPVIQVGRDWLYAPGSHDLEGQSLYIWPAAEQRHMDDYVEAAGGDEWAPPRYEIPLLGHHQVVNAAVAYAALQALRAQGLVLPEKAIQQGFRSVEWPGRFQVLATDPAVVVDAAHNRDSALKLRIALDDYFPGMPVTLIFGASGDKDIPGMLDELAPRIARLIVTQAVHPRAEAPQALAELGRTHGLRVETQVPVAAALERALALVGPGEVILAAGSLFVAGEVLAAWERIAQPTVAAEHRP